MAIGNRMYLPEGATIQLYRKNAKEPAVWTITGSEHVGEGASSVCYTALCNGKQGRLKEFYPQITAENDEKVKYYCQVRYMDYQLVPEVDKKKKINDLKKEFLRAYESLEEVKSRSDANSILNNFIPPFEILYGSPNNQGDQSVYVWTPDDKAGVAFEKYLNDVYSDISKPSDDQLYNILVTILTLTDAINALHSAKLLHLDIKPSNFLIPFTSSNEVNPGSISLFDINTLYRLGGTMPKSTGTEGYSAPELAKGNGENRSDIYSIGAMLYHALVGTGNLYSDSLYNEITEKLAASKLLNAAETNRQPELREKLIVILRNCLQYEPDNRYGSCEDLIDDLRSAIVLLEPAVKRKYLGPYRRFEIVNVELQKQKNPNAIIYNLLYKNPIYKYVQSNEKHIRVMVLGSGEFAQSFIGVALQSCQVVGRDITVTVVADDAEAARKEYLKTRPAVAEFVNINGSLQKSDKEIYGTVNFVYGHFSAGNIKENSNEINRLIKENKMPHYVFIALGSQNGAEDVLNKEIAQLFAEKVRTKALAKATMGITTGKVVDCNFINYVITDKEHSETAELGNPVYIYETITAESIDPRLDRMAFNTHLSWNSRLNLDYSELYKQMRLEDNGYNYISSIAYVLSIPYNLWSIGIDFENIDEAAEKFQKIIVAHAQQPNKEYLKMIQLGHRRWVLEKVCDKKGWQAPRKKNGKPDYDGCILRGKVKDNEAHLHPCLVRSTVDMPLKGNFYTDKQYANWNKPNEQDDKLDELDRVSIDLHRFFYAKAQKVIKERPLQRGDVAYIEKIITNEPEEVIRAFNRYRYCIRNILNGNQAYSQQFDRIETDFEDVLRKKATPEIKTVILGNEVTGSRLLNIRQTLFPVIESNMYRDYKALDEALIQNTPFILTFKPQADLVLAFEDDRLYNGRNDIIFKNVASATALNPKSITYLYYYDRYTRKDLLLRKLASVTNYLNKRALNCKISLVIAYSAGTDKKHSEDELHKLIAEIQNSVAFENITGQACADEAEACDVLANAFAKTEDVLFDGTTQPFSTATWNAVLMKNVKTVLPYFEFNFREKRFENLSQCEYLKYLETGSVLAKTYLRIEDMFSLMNAYNTKYNLPEFAEEYEIFWRIYTGSLFPTKNPSNWRNGVKNWNRLCGKLKEWADKQDEIFRVEVDAKGENYQTYVYSFPSRYIDEARDFYNVLCSMDIIASQFKLLVDTTDWCEVEINSQYDLGQLFYKIADEPEKYLAGQNLTVSRYWERKEYKEYFIVKYNNLRVVECKLDDNDSYTVRILNELEKYHYINNLNKWGGTLKSAKNDIYAGQTISFRYASPSIKKLLTTAGEILELFTYYEVLKTGYFDDVACGYEFQWERGGVLNELDGVLTKGFKSIIIECKARSSLDQNFYHKLLSVANQFGIAVKKVMIANTYENYDTINKVNDTMVERGSQMDIITIREPEQIRNIGETLKRLMFV